ncbi:MAG: Bug family tripartite tricarboxylate transporter substrate binding protein [Burkholderiales bacterium]
MQQAGLRLTLGLALTFGCVVANAQTTVTWPAKPVKIIVIASPGGLVDVAARIIANHLAKTIPHSVVVENRPGGGGNIATDFVAKSAPDGHTLLSTGSNHAVNQTLLPNPGFDYVKDVAPVTMLGQGNMLLVGTSTLQANNVAELIELAKRNPRTISIGHGPIGTPGHVASELFASMAGLDLIVVAYKGIGSAVADIVSGQVHLGIGALPAVQPLINGGRLKALAVTSEKRTPVMPNVPTVAESGVPGFDVITWISLMTTGGTPAPVIDRINTEIRTIMALPEVREAFEKQGTDVVTSTPAELATYIKAEATKWASVLKTVKVQAK